MIRDVMQNAGLEGFAEIGLVMFVIGFALVLLRVVLMDGEEAEAYSQIPLDDDPSDRL